MWLPELSKVKSSVNLLINMSLNLLYPAPEFVIISEYFQFPYICANGNRLFGVLECCTLSFSNLRTDINFLSKPYWLDSTTFETSGIFSSNNISQDFM